MKWDQHYRSLSAVKTATRCVNGRKFRDPHVPYRLGLFSFIFESIPRDPVFIMFSVHSEKSHIGWELSLSFQEIPFFFSFFFSSFQEIPLCIYIYIYIYILYIYIYMYIYIPLIDMVHCITLAASVSGLRFPPALD